MSLVVCARCGVGCDVAEFLDHMRRIHGVTEELERWPDGQVVILDSTLEPEDFQP